MQQSAMAVPPPRASTPEEEEKKEQEDDSGEDEFTFPTPPPPPPPPPQLLLGRGAGARGRDFLHLQAPPPCAASASSSPPVWLLSSSSSSSPIRRSFSAADCATASPWRERDRLLLARHRDRRRGLNDGGCSPALSDYAAGDEGDEEEERMDSLWEDLNDDDDARGEDLFFGRSVVDVSRRRSVAAATAVEGMRRVGMGKDKDQLGGGAGAVAVLGASRSSRRRPPGLVAMMRALRRMFLAHKGKSRVHRDEQSIASASSASAYSLSRKG